MNKKYLGIVCAGLSLGSFLPIIACNKEVNTLPTQPYVVEETVDYEFAKNKLTEAYYKLLTNYNGCTQNFTVEGVYDFPFYPQRNSYEKFEFLRVDENKFIERDFYDYNNPTDYYITFDNYSYNSRTDICEEYNHTENTHFNNSINLIKLDSPYLQNEYYLSTQKLSNGNYIFSFAGYYFQENAYYETFYKYYEISKDGLFIEYNTSVDREDSGGKHLLNYKVKLAYGDINEDEIQDIINMARTKINQGN